MSNRYTEFNMLKTEFLLLFTILPKTTSYQCSPSQKFLGLKKKQNNKLGSILDSSVSLPSHNQSTRKSPGPHLQNVLTQTIVCCSTATMLVLATIILVMDHQGPNWSLCSLACFHSSQKDPSIMCWDYI